jgi:hypothetical protein
VSCKRFEKITMDPTSFFFKEGVRRFWLTIIIFSCSAEANLNHFWPANILKKKMLSEGLFLKIYILCDQPVNEFMFRLYIWDAQNTLKFKHCFSKKSISHLAHRSHPHISAPVVYTMRHKWGMYHAEKYIFNGIKGHHVLATNLCFFV